MELQERMDERAERRYVALEMMAICSDENAKPNDLDR